METSARAVELEGLESELATLAAHVDAATHRLLALVRRFDQLEGWAWTGAKSSAHWLSWRIGIAPGAAREHVRVARALGELSKVDEAMRLGRLSYSKVRAITRVATPENEAALVEMGLAATGWQLEKICSGVRRMAGSRPEAHDERGVSMRPRAWPRLAAYGGAGGGGGGVTDCEPWCSVRSASSTRARA